MTIQPDQAAAALAEIDDTVARLRQSQFYQHSSFFLLLWGPIVALSYVVTQFAPQYAGKTWLAGSLLGAFASTIIASLARSGARRSFDPRPISAYAVFIGFGVALVGLGHYGPREIGAFWTLYFMTAYTMAGFWLGRAYVLIGAAVALLTMLGYAFAGPWFALWMALVNGGGLILGGLWMRRA